MNVITGQGSLPLSLADIRQAYARIKSLIVRTPLLENEAVNSMSGGRVLVKAEGLQRTGAFKYRGACNRALLLTEEQRKAGIVAWSSGNHALAVAAVSHSLGIPATIIMPEDAPRAKIEGARRFGATIRLYCRKTEDREAIGSMIAQQSGAVIVPPYDDLSIMAGQGTVGLELIEQADELKVRLDMAIAPCSGGGLVAGTAVAVKSLSPQTLVFASEPIGFDELARSLASGRLESNTSSASSICDSLQVMRPGKLTFPVNQALLAGSLVVSDIEVRQAMKVAFEQFKLVVEPGGAVALAAILSKKVDVTRKTAAVVLSGANVDVPVFVGALAG